MTGMNEAMGIPLPDPPRKHKHWSWETEEPMGDGGFVECEDSTCDGEDMTVAEFEAMLEDRQMTVGEFEQLDE